MTFDLRIGRDLAIALVIMGSALSSVRAETGVLLANAQAGHSERLATGEQLLINSDASSMPFAGRQVDLDKFVGIAGYANEVAYIAVIEGSASVNNEKAKPGQLLLLRPYGAKIGVERFDAIRLTQQWSEVVQAAAPDAYASLARIKNRQQRGVWLGRLGQTSYNVAASGSAANERATRRLMGESAVRDIRFSGASDPMAVEKMVATSFLNALKSGDAEAASALMDPTPFGGRTLAGGAGEARLIAARALIASQNWANIVGSDEPTFRDRVWRAGGATLALRPIDDFVFVSRITGDVN